MLEACTLSPYHRQAVRGTMICNIIRKTSWLLLTVGLVICVAESPSDKAAPERGQDIKSCQRTSKSEQQARNTFIEQEPLGKCNGASGVYSSRDCIAQLHACVRKSGPATREVLVTGGAGFVGSHLVDSLMLDGHKVTVLDDFSTGRKSNVQHWLGHDNFKLIHQDVATLSTNATLNKTFEQIYHLAAPASPVHYMADPVRTIKTIVLGSMNILALAEGNRRIRFVLASTSEIYGDPLVHPQTEDYWGNVNPIGPRSCYDESKRLSESLASAHTRQHSSSIAIARVFNTYGPRMHPEDGRVISNFVSQAIQNRSLTVYGTGHQTRSFQYVSDLVLGLRALMVSNLTGPINLGNPQEISISALALHVKQIVAESTSGIKFSGLPVDDPNRRRPVIDKAMGALDWKPRIGLDEGLRRTVDYFRQELDAH